MSLDVYLKGATTDVPCRCPNCDHEHTRKETEYFYDANITHNLGEMAVDAGLYKSLWRPEELGITKASQLVLNLRLGLKLLEDDPERFKKFNPKNGWGDYGLLVSFVRNYLDACEKFPDAEISVSR